MSRHAAYAQNAMNRLVAFVSVANSSPPATLAKK